MMKRLMIAVLMLMVLLPTISVAAVRVGEGQITTSVVERRPIDEIITYPAFDGELFCFTRIVGAEDETAITHKWYHDEELVSTTTLPIRSAYWRTFSSKTITTEMAGKWRVDVVDEEGIVLKNYYFTLQ